MRVFSLQVLSFVHILHDDVRVRACMCLFFVKEACSTDWSTTSPPPRAVILTVFLDIPSGCVLGDAVGLSQVTATDKERHFTCPFVPYSDAPTK